MTADPSNIRSNYLEVSFAADTFIIRFEPSFSLTAGSRQRARQATKLVRSFLRKLVNCEVSVESNAVLATLLSSDSREIAQIVDFLETKLCHLAREKLTAKAVEEVLQVAAIERQRWTKDGRLPSVGEAFIQRGQKVRLLTYAPDLIAQLVTNPATIETWRISDRARVTA